MREEILGPCSATDQLIRRLKKQNKDKEWSLKDKIHNHLKFKDYDTQYYNRRDIDTLREKLIEDIKERMASECSVCGQSVLIDDEIEYIINKRFGYEK